MLVFDLGAAVAAHEEVKRRGAPALEGRNRDTPHSRFRNEGGCMRVEEGQVVLPELGAIRVRGSTRIVRRLLRDSPGRPAGRLLFTAMRCHAGRWHIGPTLACHDIDPRRKAQAGANVLAGSTSA